MFYCVKFCLVCYEFVYLVDEGSDCYFFLAVVDTNFYRMPLNRSSIPAEVFADTYL